MATQKVEGINRKEMLQMDLNLIKFDPKQNSRFDPEHSWTPDSQEDMQFLQSILEHGQETPVWVRKDGGEYHLIAGYRRVMAIGYANEHNLSGKMKEAEVPMQVRAIVKVGLGSAEESLRDVYLASIRENKDRKQVGPCGEAHQIKHMMDVLNMDVPAVAAFYGKSEAWVTHKRLPLLSLSFSIQKQIEDAIMSADLGYMLADMPEEARQELLDFARKEKAADIEAKTGEAVDPETVKVTKSDVQKAAKKTGKVTKQVMKRSSEVIEFLDGIKADSENYTRVARKFAEYMSGWIQDNVETDILLKEFTRSFKEKYGD